MTDFPEPKFVDAGGVRLATYEAGDGFPVILLHGWPEIAYSWKNQLGPLAKAGFRAIAVDVKGFGLSDAPADKALYDMPNMTGDFAALLDALAIEKAVFCGHDWGGLLVWGMAQWRPERVAGVIGVSTPLLARMSLPPTEVFKARFGPNHYVVRFQEEDAPEELFESDVERFFRFVFRKPLPRHVWPAVTPAALALPDRFSEGGAAPDDQLVLSREDIRVYVDAFRRSGFRGGINLYRNFDRNWALMEGRDEIVRAPSLWVGADLDMYIPTELADGMDKIVPDLEKRVLSDCGHWMMWEKPAELNAILVDWLGRRMPH
ncbi:MAG TPA: alpha/beta hydrolase [Parvularculaceae bacterium]|nr:alpha/beta hydrolase [Parvularculaceae bacterium]